MMIAELSLVVAVVLGEWRLGVLRLGIFALLLCHQVGDHRIHSDIVVLQLFVFNVAGVLVVHGHGRLLRLLCVRFSNLWSCENWLKLIIVHDNSSFSLFVDIFPAFLGLSLVLHLISFNILHLNVIICYYILNCDEKDHFSLLFSWISLVELNYVQHILREYTVY